MISKGKKLIKRVKKSKDGKVLASNFGFLMLLQVAGYIFPLITIPYLARVIGVEGFGKIAFAAAVIMWFKTIADWGFNYTATRDVAINREDLDKVSEIFSNVLWARIFLTIISLVILLTAIAAIPYFKENQTILLVTFLLVPGHIFFPDWFFQAMEKMKFITLFDLASKTLFTALIFIFIKEKSDFIFQPLFISLGYVVSGVLAMYIITVKWKVKIYAPKPVVIFNTIKKSTDVFINNIVPNLYNSFSVVLLGFFGGSIANGLLDAGSKFVNISQQILNIISRVFFPFLSRYNSEVNKHSLYMRINLTIALFCSAVLMLFAPLIIQLFFTPEFEGAINILRIMSISIVFMALTVIYGTNYLIIVGQEKKLRNITLVCSLLGFASTLPLVYLYGYLGAAINILGARALLGLSVMWHAKKIMRQEND